MQAVFSQIAWETVRVGCNILFSLWPFVLLGALLPRRGGLWGVLATLVALWIVLAASRFVIALDPEPLPPLLMPEPMRTFSFVLAGTVIGIAYLLARLGHSWKA